ncbi:hypothetical protein ACFFRR_001672 [Megaselia abdita]
MVKHILQLTKEEKEDFIASFDNVFSDCDGVVWLVVGGIEGAGKGFMSLKEAGKSLKFISNNALRTDEDYIKKLSALGIDNVNPDDLIHPDKTIVTYLKSKPKYKNIFAIVGTNFREELIKNGYNVDEKPDISKPFTMKTFAENVVPSNSIDAVIMDIDLDLTYARFCRGLLYAKMYPDCDLIVGATDNLIPIVQDVMIPGPHKMIEFMEKYSGKKAVVLGKPGEKLGDHVMELYNITVPERNLFIGDNLEADIGFGKSLGFQTLFVLTGAHTYEDMMNSPDENKPSYYADSIADFVKFFESLN